VTTALEMKPEEWRRFSPRRRIVNRATQGKYLEERRSEALGLARRASLLLRRRYGAKRVVAFGSLTRVEGFGSWSDIDLPVWGIVPDEFFSALAAVTGLSRDFKIDLVEVETCRKAVRLSIERDGVEI